MLFWMNRHYLHAQHNVYTSSLNFENPTPFARRLYDLRKGRIGLIMRGSSTGLKRTSAKRLVRIHDRSQLISFNLNQLHPSFL